MTCDAMRAHDAPSHRFRSAPLRPPAFDLRSPARYTAAVRTTPLLLLCSLPCLTACGSSSTDRPTDVAHDASADTGAEASAPDASPDAAALDSGHDTFPEAAQDAPEEPPLVCPELEPDPLATTRVVANLSADLHDENRFYDFPFPSDLRLTAGGSPDVAGFPHGLLDKIVVDLLLLVPERKGWPVIPVAWFKFDAALPDLSDADETVIPAEPTSSILLIDTDEASPERGRLFPVVATTPTPDGKYVPDHLLAVAARPGFVLAPKRRYAFVVTRTFRDAAGHSLAIAPTIGELLAGNAPAAPKGQAARLLYAPLIETLESRGICPNTVAAATVFTTGDVVESTATISEALRPKYPVEIQSLAVDPDDGADHQQFCELRGKVVYPQFQEGSPPFNTYGRFDIGSDGLPVKLREEEAPITITIPKGAMPAGGYPLLMFFHGSGGLSTAVVDRGLWHWETDPSKCPEGTLSEWDGKKGCNTKGMGPAHYLSLHGIAAVGSALPVNPERYPGAKETEYLNLLNLSAFRDTFRQGVIEQRLLLDAMLKLKIPPQILAACSGISLPSGETHFRFRSDPVLAQGQSMGGMYTNMVGAVEPRIKAVTPTGAGGFWSYFILKGNQVPGGATTLSFVLGTKGKLSFLHPAMHLLELAWEPADPIVSMPRLARRPLPGHPVRPIYEPVGKDDSYFPMEVYDAIALAYGHRQAGNVVWPAMQDALALDGLDGLLPYPASQASTSVDGAAYTGVIVQYPGDGVYDPHALYSQRDEVKYQYGCFFSSFLKTGVAKVPAPAPIGTPCP